MVEITSPADIRSQPIRPVQRVLNKQANTAFLYRVAADGRQELPLHGIVQVEPDIVVAALHADFGLHRQASKLSLECVRPVDAADNAVVVLMKLIAIDGISEKVGEVVPQVERTLDEVEIGLRRAGFIRLRPAAR